MAHLNVQEYPFSTNPSAIKWEFKGKSVPVLIFTKWLVFSRHITVARGIDEDGWKPKVWSLSVIFHLLFLFCS